MFSDSIIVLPWDFSTHAKAALQFALENAPIQNLRLICILERPNPYASGVQWWDGAEDRARTACIDQFHSLYPPDQFANLSFESNFGEPATEIVKYASGCEAGMILMSTHGRTGLQRILLGSVANQVAQIATCPVLLLPQGWFESRQGVTDTEAPAATN